MNRKIVPAVQEIYKKHGTQSNARRLLHDDAIKMLQEEFGIEEWHAEEFYRHYKLATGDDGGSDALSLWEFQHFYNNVGKCAQSVVSDYDSLDNPRKGYITADQLKTYLENTKLADGEQMTEKEVTMFLKTVANENELVTLGKFSDLVARVKLYKRPPKK